MDRKTREQLAAKAGVTIERADAIMDALDGLEPEERREFLRRVKQLGEWADRNGISIEELCRVRYGFSRAAG
jgi:hypothetical protein